MRCTSRFSARLFGLAFAVPFTLTGAAQAQTAQGTQTAPEPQAPASVQIEVETFDAASTSLRAQYAQMVRHSGKVLTFAPTAEANAGKADRFVLYAPLNRLWLLDATGAVTRHARIEVRQEPFDHLVLHWRHWSDADIADILPAAAQMPALTVAPDTPHPLATAYDALLSRPLARAFDSQLSLSPLPAGAYFRAGGHIFDATGAPIAEWDSYGDAIVLRLIAAETDATKPLWQWFAVADLAAALVPELPFEPEGN